jgi:hypothetical protein
MDIDQRLVDLERRCRWQRKGMWLMGLLLFAGCALGFANQEGTNRGWAIATYRVMLDNTRSLPRIYRYELSLDIGTVETVDKLDGRGGIGVYGKDELLDHLMSGLTPQQRIRVEVALSGNRYRDKIVTALCAIGWEPFQVQSPYQVGTYQIVKTYHFRRQQ